MRGLRLALLLLVYSWCFAAASAEKRVALVIGNGAYEKAAPLTNPVNDATDMAAKLETIGFEVHRGLDLDSNEMRNLIVRFGRATETADIALFFYAGHGIQAGGENYLVPIEAEIEFENEIGLTLIPTTQVLDQLGRAKSSRLVFLDACRDNPFKRQLMKSMGTRSATPLHEGLSQPRRIPDTYIAYATQPDTVADDGSGRNSPFTAALLKYIDEPGLAVHDFMLKVGNDVRAATDDRQEPWSASTLRERFFFVPAAASGVPASETTDVVDRFTAALELGSRTGWQEFMKDFEGDPSAQRYLKIARTELENFPSPPEPADAAKHTEVNGEPVPGKFPQRLLPDGSETLDTPAPQAAADGVSVAMIGPANVASYDSGDASPQPASGKAIFYREKTKDTPGSAEPGTVEWSEVSESPGGNMPPEPAIRADAVIPGMDTQLRLTIKRNADPNLPASHIIEMIFLTPEGFEDGTIDRVVRVTFKDTEAAAGDPLVGVPAKIADGFFLLALDTNAATITTNTEILRRPWIDIALTFTSGRRALITLNKGEVGKQVFDQALAAWKS